MADYDKDRLLNEVVHAGEYGNKSTAVGSTTAARILTTAGSDRVFLKRLPAGTRLIDGSLFHGAGGGSAAVNMGYVPVNADDGAGDPDYFLAAASVVSAGRTRANTVTPPVIVPYDFYIVVAATTVFANAISLTASIDYEWVGA